ncbi:Retrovirus-related Pol polyprotein from transposon RE1 [Vitis vinifera]|uniref:Retrovirus-related Pol polyprotein from transposon RE1 n=1 Tax=Vitis vinifera TaxID=29760 RepID=A0A438H3C0_VITVI|nr:Retrovirus-related Pol polyprotein from transposon RE1 [Vitis vinifera]
MITSEKLEADIPEVERAKGLYTNDIQRLYKVASAIVHISQQDLDLSTYIDQIASLKEEFLTVMPLTPDVGAQQTQLDKFFMALTLIGLRPDLEPVRDQILGSSSVPSLDDVFARLLRISSTQTLPSDSISDSSVLVSHTTSRGGRSGNRGRGQRPHCTYCNKLGHTRDRCYQLHGRPPRTAHVAQSSDSQLPQPPSSSASQASQASVASVAQPGNASACLTHTSSLGPWILDSGASDHLSGNKDLFSSITTTSALPTVTLANGSQTVAKGIGLTLPLPFLPLTSVLYTPECPFNLISISKITRTLNCSITFSNKFVTLQDRSTGKTIGIGLVWATLVSPSSKRWSLVFSTLSSLSCESCQLGKHTRVSFPKRLNNRAKSPFELVHTDVWGPCQTASTLEFQYFVTFIDDYSRCLSSSPLCRCFSPFAKAPANSLPIPSASPAPALPSPDDLPIAIRKGTHEVLFPSKLATGQWWMKWMLCTLMALGILLFLPSGKSIVGCRWVYAVKVGPDGQVDRLKARLVAKGYTQVYGSDYGDTFSPVAKIASFRLLLSMAAMWGVWFSVQVTPFSIWLETISSSMCIYLVVYVDDIVITGSDQDGIQKLKQHLFTHFQTKDLGKLKYFLGIEIAQSSSGVVLSQRKTRGAFRRPWGDIDGSHWDAVIRILRYIKSTPGQGVLYENRGHTQVVGYTDADWAGSPTDRRSTSGAEAEYRAMALATCELIWLRHLLRELRFGKDEQMKLICDNQATLHIASNPVFHERTKHIEVDCHFIREKIASGCVATSFVNSNDQLADIFTKSLRGPRIKYICNKLGAYDVYAPTRGGVLNIMNL